MFQDADATYQRALNMTQTADRMTTLERMFTYSEAADFYDRREKFSDAEGLYRQALALASQLPPSPNHWSLNLRSQLAHVIGQEGNPNQADAILAEQPTLAVPASRVPRSSPLNHDLSGPLTDIARARQFAAEGNSGDAETAFLRAISALQKINDPAAQSNAMGALDQLADFYSVQHRYPEAETTLSRAFSLWETVAGQPESKMAAVPPLGIIQTLYFDEKEPEKAEALYRRALDVQDRMLPPDDPAIGSTLMVLADANVQQGNYQAALPLFQRALAIDEKKWGADSPLLAGVLDPYATALEKLNRPDEAAALRARIKTLRSAQPAR